MAELINGYTKGNFTFYKGSVVRLRDGELVFVFGIWAYANDFGGWSGIQVEVGADKKKWFVPPDHVVEMKCGGIFEGREI